MDFSVAPATADLVARARAFVDERLVPLEPAFLGGPFQELAPALDECRAEVRRLGMWAPPLPREYGGMGLGLVEYALVSEVLGRSPLGHYAFNAQAPDAGNVELIHHAGTPEQRAAWLPDLVAGRARSAFAMTEVGTAGSNPTLLEATARREGDEWVVDAHKWFTTGADGARLLVVMAVTDPEAAPHERASMLLVPADTPGYTLVRNVPVMGHAGDGWHSHAEVRFEGCRVPAANLLGERGRGFALAQTRLGPGRIHHCMRWLGIAQRALDMMGERAASRVVGPGPGEVLADKQLVQAAVAESSAELQAARWLVLHTAWRIQQEGARAARTDVSLIKFHTAGVLQRVVDRALQVHGGLGVTDDTVLAYFYRAERAARIYDGADEVHKTSAGRRLLRAHRERAS